MAAGKCDALLSFANLQLSRVARPSHVNLSYVVEQAIVQNAGLIVCVHDGELFYQIADAKAKHVMHGDRDRAWQALNVIFHTLRHAASSLPATSGTKCWQHSLRDDQKQNIFRWGDGLGLPTFLWHREEYQAEDAPWGAGYRAERTSTTSARGRSSPAAAGANNRSMAAAPPRPDALIDADDDAMAMVHEPSSTPPNERPVVGHEPPKEGAAWEAAAARARFLWPEHTYFGELVRGLPPMPAFRSAMRRAKLPWGARSMTMRYRGSAIGRTRQHVLTCARMPQNLSAWYGPRGAVAGRFFGKVLDSAKIGWTSVGGLQLHPAGTPPTATSTSSSHADGDGGGGGTTTQDGTGSLGAYGAHKHVLWLPGGADWSSALSRLLSAGAAVYMPADLGASHSLLTFMLLERCKQCVVGFYRLGDAWRDRPANVWRPASWLPYAELDVELKRNGRVLAANTSVCVALSEAYGAHAAKAEGYAQRLAAFEEEELRPACMVRYMRALIDGLPQKVLDTQVLDRARDAEAAWAAAHPQYVVGSKNRSSSSAAEAMATAGAAPPAAADDARGGFRHFTCAHSHDLARRLIKHGVPLAHERFDAWFDTARNCALREAPL